MEVFLRNPNRIFSMDALLDKVWPFDDTPTTGAIRTHIKGLRQKMKTVGLAEAIDTVYGMGYRLSPAIAVVVPPKDAGKTFTKASKAIVNKRAVPPEPTPEVALSAIWQPVRERYLQRVESLAKTLNELPPDSPQQTVHEDIATDHSGFGIEGGGNCGNTMCQTLDKIVGFAFV